MAIEKLTGKVAIVTGGASGIGGEIARTLAGDEAQVLIIDIDESTATANVERIEAAGGKATSMAGDVAREEVAKEMVERAVAEFGRLDILVQNAFGVVGFSASGSAVEVELDNWRRGMDLLVGAHFLGAKYAVPAMEASGPPAGFAPEAWEGRGLRRGSPPPREVGRIVNISSTPQSAAGCGVDDLRDGQGSRQRTDQADGHRLRAPGHHRQRHRAGACGDRQPGEAVGRSR